MVAVAELHLVDKVLNRESGQAGTVKQARRTILESDDNRVAGCPIIKLLRRHRYSLVRFSQEQIIR